MTNNQACIVNKTYDEIKIGDSASLTRTLTKQDIQLFAISREAAAVKGIRSDVAGDADILVVPDVESGNMLYKELRYFSGVQGAGIVLGAKVPIILTSRAGDAENRVISCALALLYTRGIRV